MISIFEPALGYTVHQPSIGNDWLIDKIIVTSSHLFHFNVVVVVFVSWAKYSYYLVVVSPDGERESHGEDLVVGAGLEAAVAAQIVRLSLQVAQQARHVRVGGPVRRLAVDVVAKVGVGHHEYTADREGAYCRVYRSLTSRWQNSEIREKIMEMKWSWIAWFEMKL